MDKKLKAKWLKALRSGQYKQCTKVLYDGKGHCCLGVLQKVIRGKNPPETWETDRAVPLPMRFLNKILAPGSKRNLHMTLAVMNDGGQSFPQIADWIEANL